MKINFICWGILAFLIASLGLHARRMQSTMTEGIPRILLMYDNQYIKIEVLSDELIHFEMAKGKRPLVHTPIYTTPMVEKKSFLGPTKYYEHHDGFETAKLHVTFEHQTRCIKTYDTSRNFLIGKICASNLDQAWKKLHFDSPIVKNLYGLGQFFTNPGTTDGDLIGRVWDPLAETHGHSMVPFSEGASTRSMFPIIYALGPERENFAVFVDNIYKQMWTMNEQPWQGRFDAEMWGDQLRFYIIAGEDLPTLRRSYLDLTGRPALPRKRVLGLWVSEFGFDSWDELKQKLNSLVTNKFPIEGFAMDLQWFGGRFYPAGSDLRGSRMGTLEFDEVAFPNAKREIDNLRRNYGVELMLIEESYISKYQDIHDLMAEQGFLAHKSNTNEPVLLTANPWWGIGGMIDWTNARAADFWHDEKRQKLIDLGINFHWADLGEPEMYDPEAQYFGFPELGKNSHADVHNIYALKWLESITRGYKRNNISSRFYVMSRAGTSGIQRFGGMWSGDLGANMGSLTAHWNAAQMMSLSGVDYYSSDIGGFHRSTDLSAEDANELYTQWFANAALFDMPVRPHAWNIGNNLETSPSLMGDIESNLANLRLRYRLTPYYYTLMHRAHENGEAIIPPLVYYFQKDPNVRLMGHERMIGPSLLAGVIARHGESSRKMYLPKGRWYDYYSGKRYDSSGQWTKDIATIQNHLFRLPLFAKAGAIIPLMSVDDETMNVLGQRRDGTVNFDLNLRIYADLIKSEFELIEDDGISNNQKRSITKISHIPKNNKAIIIINSSEGSFWGPEAKRVIMLQYHPWRIDVAKKIFEVTINGLELPKCVSNSARSQECYIANSSGLVELNLGMRKTSDRQEIIIKWKS